VDARESFELAFIDADKARIQACFEGRLALLRPGRLSGADRLGIRQRVGRIPDA
jgi:predicted O-methyltransferase YrrM